MIAAGCLLLLVVPIALVIVNTVGVNPQTTWTPSSGVECRKNDDCGEPQRLCCSITPALGRRRRQLVVEGGDLMVHYCLPYKTQDSPWCELSRQYSPLTPNYLGLCPCGPGLQCSPTEELDPRYYPRDRFGKCTPA